MRHLDGLLPTIDPFESSDPLGLIDLINPSLTRPPGPPEPTAMPMPAPNPVRLTPSASLAADSAARKPGAIMPIEHAREPLPISHP
jgi:hypothetical protein